MLPVTRANLDYLCSTCLIDIRPSVYTQKVFDVQEENNLSKWLKLTAHITVLRNPINQKHIETYCKKLCEICYLKSQYSYYFREKILSSTIAIKEVLENEEITEDGIQKLQTFCRICLNRQKGTQEQTFTMENLKWLRNCSGLSFTGLNERDIFRLKEGTNITELMVINDAQFPKQLCSNCRKKLKNMEEFRALSTQSFEYMLSVMGDGDKPPPPKTLKSFVGNVVEITQESKTLLEANNEKRVCKEVEQKLSERDTVLQDEIKIEEEQLMYPELKIFENSENESDQMYDERANYSDDSEDFIFNENQIERSLEKYPLDKLEDSICTVTLKTSPNEAPNNSLETDPISCEKDPKDTLLTKKILRKTKNVIVKDKKANLLDDGHDIQLKTESETVSLHEDLKKKQPKAKNGVRKPRKKKKQEQHNDDIENENDSKDPTELLKEQSNNNENNAAITLVQTERPTKKPKLRKFKCDLCPRTYSKEIFLNTHILQHQGVKQSFNCDKCSKTFRTIYILQRHQTEIHGSLEDNEEDANPTALVCSMCCQVFKRKQHLIDHTRAVHEKLKPFKCGYCDKMFATPGNKRVHELCHTETYPFVCDWCAKRFRQSNQLKVHLEIHTTQPELLCPICKRAQKTEESLHVHLKLHDEKRLQCPSCGKFFSKASHLQDHQNAVHLKLRPFKCEFCDLAFGDRKTRKVHEKSHTEDRPEICPICKRGFKSRNTLGRHMKEFGHLTEEFIKNSKKGKKKSELKPAENVIKVSQAMGGFHFLLNHN